VWVDRQSGYGTFPLESMKSGVPVIGIVPDLVPSWMNENNGIWIKDQILLPELIADWSQNWLEDNISQEIIAKMDETVEKLPTKESFEKHIVDTFSTYINNRASSMEEQISKFTE
jgi:glycosyltransferase involved in cell wall biosynthesis